jgi:hypothetical protein
MFPLLEFDLGFRKSSKPVIISFKAHGVGAVEHAVIVRQTKGSMVRIAIFLDHDGLWLALADA